MTYGKEPFFLWFAPKKQLSVYFSPKMGANGKRRAFFILPLPLFPLPPVLPGAFLYYPLPKENIPAHPNYSLYLPVFIHRIKNFG